MKKWRRDARKHQAWKDFLRVTIGEYRSAERTEENWRVFLLGWYAYRDMVLLEYIKLERGKANHAIE